METREIIVDDKVIGELSLPEGTTKEEWDIALAAFQPPREKTQEELDLEKYEKRASVKDKLIAKMAVGNVNRVRTGTWSVNDLVAMTQDEKLKQIVIDLNTLSFELAIHKVMLLDNPLVTQEIKMEWINMLKESL